jgi:hypothetical protein
VVDEKGEKMLLTMTSAEAGALGTHINAVATPSPQTVLDHFFMTASVCETPKLTNFAVDS